MRDNIFSKPRHSRLTWCLLISGVAGFAHAKLGDPTELTALSIDAQQQLFRAAQQKQPVANSATTVERFGAWQDPSAQWRLAQFAQLNSATEPTISASENCGDAPVLNEKQVRVGWRLAAAKPLSVRWFRMPVLAGRWTLEAFAIDDDVALSAHNECNTAAFAHADDDVLLQPRLPLAGSAAKSVWIKVEQIRGSAVGLSVQATGSVSGSFSPGNGTVSAYLPSGVLLASSQSSLGSYSLELPPGDYYLRGIGSGLDELYNDVDCPSVATLSQCNLSATQPIGVVAGQQLSNINFSLSPGARIVGKLLDARNGQGVSGSILVKLNGIEFYANTDSIGRYQIGGLPAGDASLAAQALNFGGDAYRAQRYLNRNCPGSSLTNCPTSNDTVSVPRDGLLVGLDFALSATSSIQGNVVSGGSVQIALLDPSGKVVAGTNTYGSYRIDNVPVGSYRVRFANASHSMLYPDLICQQANCADRLAQATLVTVATPESSVVGIDANFPAPRVLKGRLIDRATGAAIVGRVVLAQDGGFVQEVSTDFLGSFQFFAAPAGAVRLFASSDSHIDAFYPATQCQAPLQNNCNVQSSTLTSLVLPLLGGVTTVEFPLELGATITGTSLRRSGQLSFDYRIVQVASQTGALLPSTQFLNNGQFLVQDLQPGSYTLRFPETDQYFESPSQLVQVTAGQHLTGVTSVLQLKRGFEGRITDTAGNPLAGVVVDLWHGATRVASAQSDSLGWYFINIYYDVDLALSTDAPGAYTNQVHRNIQCPLGPVYLGRCRLNQAQLVPGIAQQPGDHIINFQLAPAAPGEDLFFNGFEDLPN